MYGQYMGYQYPMMPGFQYPVPMQPMQNVQSNEIQGIRFVDGLEDAQNCVTLFGTKVLLMDKNSDKFYIKETDTSGVSTVSEYEFRKVTHGQQTADYVTREELEARIAQLTGGGLNNEPTVGQSGSASNW